MIQRIQTVFYLLAALCAAGLFFLPMASSPNAMTPFFEDKLFSVQDHIAILILAGLSIVLPIVAIFMFKNRATQLRVGNIGIIFCILFVVATAVIFMNGGQEMVSNGTVNDEAGIYLPVGTIIFSIIANRFVKKDDNLVQSMDRLR